MSFLNLKGQSVIFPTGKSMRPFLYGGRAVWYTPLRSGDLSQVHPGDILVVDSERKYFIHRLVEILGEESGEVILTTKGDPLLSAERFPSTSVIGKVTKAMWRDGVIVSFEEGFLNRVHRIYSRIIIWLYALEKRSMTPEAKPGSQRYRFRGWVYQAGFRFFLFPFFYGVIGLATLSQRVRQRADIRERSASVWSFLCQWAKRGYREDMTPSIYQLQSVLDHDLAGLVDLRAESRPVWQPLVEQKKRQIISAIRALDLFEAIAEKCQNLRIPVIPLKAVSLYHSIYRHDPSERNTGDIDLLVPLESAESFRQCVSELGFRPKKGILLGPEILKIKRKMELFPDGSYSLSLDVKLSPVTKRLLGRFVSLTTESLFQRASVLHEEKSFIRLLNPVDEWLYLAQHYVLHHRLCGMKWLADLYRYTWSLSPEHGADLFRRAECTGLKKIAAVTVYALAKIMGPLPEGWTSFLQVKLGAFARSWTDLTLEPKRILNQHFDKRHGHLLNKIEEIHWEILFIDRKSGQWRAFFRNLFPSRQMMDAYFGRPLGWTYFLRFPIHIAVWLSTWLIFFLDYALRRISSIRIG
jgi:hypothetical protein